MYLKEYQGKELFSQYGIPIPHGFAIFSPSAIKKPLSKLSGEVAVKAQTIGGGRGKAGLVRIVPHQKAATVAASFFKAGTGEVLLEEKVDVAKELYLSLTIDGRSLLLLFSERGGVDIEEVASRHPEEVVRRRFMRPERMELFPKAYRREAIAITRKMHRLMTEKDAVLVEINPLMLTKSGKLVAGDAKVVIDDNALYRHPEFRRQAAGHPLERKARAYGLHYVELPNPKGDIAVIGNGAGLVMASLDLIYYYGGHPASFLDLGGGTGAEAMEKALEISLAKPGIKGVFINIFAGITRADEVAEAIVKSWRRAKAPVVIRMVGTEEARARKMLEAAGLSLSSSMEMCVKDIIRKVR